jgi:hypothetical protein
VVMLPATHKIRKLFNELAYRDNENCILVQKNWKRISWHDIAVDLRATVLLRFFMLRETVNSTDTRHSSDRRTDIAVET